jgi:hypothetical protein
MFAHSARFRTHLACIRFKLGSPGESRPPLGSGIVALVDEDGGGDSDR